MELRTIAAAAAALVALLSLAWPYIPGLPSLGPQQCPLGYGTGDGSREGGDPRFGNSQPPSSLVLYTNAALVWTGDISAPHAEEFVVDTATKRFAFVGSTAAAAAAVAAGSGPHQTVDLKRAHVIPGLIDSHLHLIPGGLSLSRLSLAGVTSRQQFESSVAAAAAALQPGQWLLSGGGWDESHWGGEAPNASWIDDVTGDTPTWLLRHDAHSGLANTAALRRAGVAADSPDPPGGSIVRGIFGQPTGLLTDAAMQLVADRIPPLTVEERLRALEAAAQQALSRGITTVHDMGRIAFMEGEKAAWQDLEEVYAPAADEGRLPLRVYAFVALPTWRRLAERVRHLGRAHPSGMLFWGGVKEFADGSLGSRTALFHDPYADQATTRGTRTIQLDRLRALVAAADRAGLQVAIHAIGDAAVDDVAALYAELATNHSAPSTHQQEQGQEGRRVQHRIEHAQHLTSPAAAARLAAAGIIVTPNPLHLPADAGILVARLGPGRARAGRSYAFRTLVGAGVTTAFASDWPVVPLEPAGTLHVAVHRRAAGSSDPAWAPEEALSVDEALAAHTAAGAAAAGLESDLGRIAPGMLADFVVLSGPPVGTADGAQSAGGVQRTYVGGACAWGCGGNDVRT